MNVHLKSKISYEWVSYEESFWRRQTEATPHEMVYLDLLVRKKKTAIQFKRHVQFIELISGALLPFPESKLLRLQVTQNKTFNQGYVKFTPKQGHPLWSRFYLF